MPSTPPQRPRSSAADAADERLNTAVSGPLTSAGQGAPAFHLLAKPTGPICNLDCEYCFFLSKEMLYPGDRFRRADDLLETYIRQLLEAHRTPEVTIAWQGGEPTMMCLDFFERSVELAAGRSTGTSATGNGRTQSTRRSRATA